MVLGGYINETKAAIMGGGGYINKINEFQVQIESSQ